MQTRLMPQSRVTFLGCGRKILVGRRAVLPAAARRDKTPVPCSRYCLMRSAILGGRTLACAFVGCSTAAANGPKAVAKSLKPVAKRIRGGAASGKLLAAPLP